MRSLLIALSLGLAACSVLVNADGLTGGHSEATSAQPDGAVADGDTPRVDGGDATEVDSGDATAADDAGKLDSGDAGPVSPCAASHLFCDDFDTGSLVGRWDQMETTAGPLEFDTTTSVSPSRSLLATVQPKAGINVRATCLHKLVAVPANKARFEIDLRRNAPSGTTYEQVDFLAMYLWPAPPGYTMQVLGLLDFLRAISFEVYTDGPGGPVSNRKPAGFAQTWVHVTFEADFTTTPATGAIFFDGILAAKTNLAGTSLTSVDIRVGPGFANSANVTWPLAYDNAIVDP